MSQKLAFLMGICSLKFFVVSVLSVAFTLLSIMSLLATPLTSHPLSMSWRFSSPSFLKGQQSQNQKGDTLDLQRVLRQTAMPDKTVIITTLNQAWATRNTMIDLFLESFSLGINTTKFLNHLLIVALDQQSYDRCVGIHSHCFQLRTVGVDFSGEKSFMTPDYLNLMWRRIDFLRQILEEGYSFVFSDADIMWFRDPFPYISPDADVQIACDHYLGYPKSLRNRANGGFLYARANKRTINFYKYWYMAKEVFPGMHDQDVLNKIKRDDALLEFGLRLEFFDTKYISGFCQSSHDFEKVVTMHANCCYGLQSKLDDLRQILADWRKFRSMTPSRKRFEKLMWSAPKACLSSSSLVH
ncbi:hypothetical protein GOP47_0025675 [Adiantum capillus-veneris]|uniref:Glycosyltransferase n=1 Tax=Adiantum capillus-veneris TaxID=13818 RepID=A0A9D4U360_ADICA|nr:hypothetical protein GOP47_0025675 [Adiantum capillus-veneris]